MHQMLATAKADFQPQGFAREARQINRRAVWVFLPDHARQTQPAEVFFQIGLLAGAQGFAMHAAIKIAALYWIIHGLPSVFLWGL